MNDTERPYSPKEISLDLDVGDSTLRKWCIALEEAGYLFSRTDNQRRVFFNKDHIVLKQFQNLVQVQNMPLQNAAIIIASKYKEDFVPNKNSENTALSIRSGNQNINELLERIRTLEKSQNQLIEMNMKLMERFGEQQLFLEERLKKHDSILMESIRESQETKKLLIEQRDEQKKKKGIFKFFGK